MDQKNYQNTYEYQQNQQFAYPALPNYPVQSQPTFSDVNSQNNILFKPKRSWSFGLFSCFDDLEGLLCAFFCAPCFEYMLFERAGEGLCDCLCAGHILLRTKIRTERAIEGSLCEDVFTAVCCRTCSLVQLSNEMKASPPLI